MDDSRVGRSSSDRRLAVRAFALTLTALLAASCTETASQGGGAACTFRQVVSCEGPAGCTGMSVCLDDLSSFGPCTCGDAGPSDDAGSSGDAS